MKLVLKRVVLKMKLVLKRLVLEMKLVLRRMLLEMKLVLKQVVLELKLVLPWVVLVGELKARVLDLELDQVLMVPAIQLMKLPLIHLTGLTFGDETLSTKIGQFNILV